MVRDPFHDTFIPKNFLLIRLAVNQFKTIYFILYLNPGIKTVEVRFMGNVKGVLFVKSAPGKA